MTWRPGSRLLMPLGLAAALMAQAAAAEETAQRSFVIEKLIENQEYQVTARLRTDLARLAAIRAVLETAIENPDRSLSPDQIDDIALVLSELRLPSAEVTPVRQTIQCVQSAISAGRDLQSCRPQQIARPEMLTTQNPKDTARAIVALGNRGGIAADALQVPVAFAADKIASAVARTPYSISFFGQSVDLESGRFFAMLAKDDPQLLRPIPFDRGFQLERCINGNFAPVVSTDAAGAAERLMATLAESEKPYFDEEGDVFRFGMWQSELGDVVGRVGGSYPDKLADFTLEDAYALVLAWFAHNYGMDALGDDPAVPALLTLWQVMQDEGFERRMSEFLGRKLGGEQIGPALAETSMNGQELWEAIYQSVARGLHCADANKVFEAYGLVYRGGDYPSARRVLRSLRQTLGYTAVPSLATRPVQQQFFENVPQNCRVFGPVEFDYSGNSGDDCNLGEIDLGAGTVNHIALGGGLEIEFLVTAEERERLSHYMRRLESEFDRGGDILRWSARGELPIEAQSTGSSFAMPTWDNSWDKLPCVLGMSFYLEPGDTEGILQHFEDYKKNFFPTTGRSLDGDNWELYMIDEFDGFQKPDFAEKLLPLAKTLEANLTTAREMAERKSMDLGLDGLVQPDGEAEAAPGGETVPALEEIKPDFETICANVERQMFEIKETRKVSHGAFLESLLIGASSSISGIDKLGLLNADGDVDPGFFAERYKPYKANQNISKVADQVQGIRKSLERADAVSGGNAPVAVVNVSLGKSYLRTGGAAYDLAEKAVARLKTDFATGNEALFVFSAGQPENELDSTRGTELKLLSVTSLDVRTSECAFFPACFSALKNVITVGAVKPSPGSRGYRKALLTPWSNFGSAVTVAAPGQSVLGNEFAYLPNDDPLFRLKTMPISSLRDGTSIATVFVTALAAKLAAENSTMNPAEIKTRILSTVRPYIASNGQEELLRGAEGQIYAGVIDPQAALRDPSKYHVAFRDGRPPVEYDLVRRVDPTSETEKRPLWLFETTSASEPEKLTCDWRRLLRLHFDDEYETDDTWQRPIPEGSVVCKNRWGDIAVGAGYFGTKNVKQNSCLRDDVCFEALSAETGGWVPLRISEIRDLYFPVIAP